MSTSPIPTFYKVIFLYVDPFINAFGIYISFFKQAYYLESAVPKAITQGVTLTPSLRYLIFAQGSFSLAIFAMQVWLLREFKDAPNGLNLKIWRFVQASILLIDLGMVYATWDAVQGRSGPSTWDAEEWSAVGLLGAASVARSAFLAKLGF